jgi:capsular polysaccharide biosynthesis protein
MPQLSLSPLGGWARSLNAEFAAMQHHRIMLYTNKLSTQSMPKLSELITYISCIQIYLYFCHNHNQTSTRTPMRPSAKKGSAFGRRPTGIRPRNFVLASGLGD